MKKNKILMEKEVRPCSVLKNAVKIKQNFKKLSLRIYLKGGEP